MGRVKAQINEPLDALVDGHCEEAKDSVEVGCGCGAIDLGNQIDVSVVIHRKPPDIQVEVSPQQPPVDLRVCLIGPAENKCREPHVSLTSDDLHGQVSAALRWNPDDPRPISNRLNGHRERAKNCIEVGHGWTIARMEPHHLRREPRRRPPPGGILRRFGVCAGFLGGGRRPTFFVS